MTLLLVQNTRGEAHANAFKHLQRTTTLSICRIPYHPSTGICRIFKFQSTMSVCDQINEVRLVLPTNSRFEGSTTGTSHKSPRSLSALGSSIDICYHADLMFSVPHYHTSWNQKSCSCSRFDEQIQASFSMNITPGFYKERSRNQVLILGKVSSTCLMFLRVCKCRLPLAVCC